MLKQQPFLQSSVLLVSMLLLHQQPYIAVAERRTDEVVDVMMSNIHEQEDDAFTISGSTKKRNGSDKKGQHDVSDPLEGDITVISNLYPVVQGQYDAIKNLRDEAARIIKQGEEDAMSLRNQIAKVDARLNNTVYIKERCSARIKKANKGLTEIQIEYVKLIAKADKAITCLKGDCTEVETDSTSTVPEVETASTSTLPKVDTISTTPEVETAASSTSTEVGTQEGRKVTDATKESIATSTFLRHTATTPNI